MIKLTPMPKIKDPLLLSPDDFEEYYREELSEVYSRLNDQLWNGLCKYTDFVWFAWKHSSRFKPRDFAENRRAIARETLQLHSE